jgi:hypothetical protein
MCGIFFLLHSVNGKFQFKMNFFEAYLNNPYFTKHHIEIGQYILSAN